ncbi:MAG: hypothetical protein AB1351_01790 [Thermoproteota archaeon]
MTKNLTGRHFALCESCFWSATILTTKEDVTCPMCTGGSISLIPLAANDEYRIKLGTGGGLELSFSKRSAIHS